MSKTRQWRGQLVCSTKVISHAMNITEQVTAVISHLQTLAEQAAQRAQDATGNTSAYWLGTRFGLETAIAALKDTH